MCSKKELGFFHNHPNLEPTEAYRNYVGYFPGIADSDNWLLEATPTYLDGGRKTAKRLQEVLYGPKLIFVLREPTSRLISYYKSKHGLETSKVSGVSFEQFVEKALAQESSSMDDSERRKSAGWQLAKAHYGRFLLEYLEVFDATDMLVTFFDDLIESPLRVTEQVCRFLDVDSAFYMNYRFLIENKSRVHRSAGIRTLASHMNAVAEPILNRVPSWRRMFRTSYNLVNVSKDADIPVNENIISELAKYYAPYNRQTAEVLSDRFALTDLPLWLA